MQNRESLTEEALRRALGPTDDCPAIEELESLASGEAIATGRWSGHLQTCGYCQTELHLLKKFLLPNSGEPTQIAGKAAELLATKKKEIFKRAFPAPERVPWWRSAFAVRRVAQASFAMAAVLLVVAAVLFFRSSTSQPQLDARNQTGPEVLRSGNFALLSPAGDLKVRPTEIRWEQVQSAASYQVRLLEVDRSELWKGSTTADHIELPAAVQDKIVPAKTLFAEITAFDPAGKKLATTGAVRFRVIQASNQQ
jgi:hypothetical protein